MRRLAWWADCVLVVDQNDVVIGGDLIDLQGSAVKTKALTPEGMAWQAGATIGGVIAVKRGALYRLQPQK